MISARFSTVVSAGTAIVLVVALAAGIFSIPRTSQGAPVVVVIFTAAVAATGVAIYDYNSCDINILWGCSSNGGSAGGGGGKSGAPDAGGKQGQRGEPTGTDNQKSQGDASQGGSTGGIEVCNSAPNACGAVNTGFINQKGQCSAIAPPLSACPAPTIGATGFYAEPARVKSGNTSTLHWNVTNATGCAITGGGLSLAGLGTTGQHSTNSIREQTTFTLTCENGAVQGAPSNQANTTVNIIPTYKEI